VTWIDVDDVTSIPDAEPRPLRNTICEL